MWTVNLCVNGLQSSINFALSLSLSFLFTFHQPKSSMRRWWWSFVRKFNSYPGLIRLTLNTARLVFFKYPLKRRFFFTQLEFFISILFDLFSTCDKHVQLLTVASWVHMNSIIEIREFFYFSAFHVFLLQTHKHEHTQKLYFTLSGFFRRHFQVIGYICIMPPWTFLYFTFMQRSRARLCICLNVYYSTETLSSSLHTCYFTSFFTSFQSI